MFNFFKQKKAIKESDKDKVSAIKRGDLTLVMGQGIVKIDSANAGVEKWFSRLLKIVKNSEGLISEDLTSTLSYIVDYHHYGKKAGTVYKSFCVNEIELEGLSDLEELEARQYLGSLLGDTKVNGLIALQQYLVKSVLIQGGLAFFIDLKKGVDGEFLSLINLPLTTIIPVIDKETDTIKYSCQEINLSKINEGLPEEAPIKYASESNQFFLFVYDKDIRTGKPIPFFSAAPEVLYTEGLFGRLIREIVNRLSILKYAHYIYKSDALGGKSIFPEDTKDKEEEATLAKLKSEVDSPSGSVVDSPSTGKKYAFFQGTALTDENVEIKTYSTLENQAIEPVRKAVERPLSSALMVPAQLIGLSDSRTETQYGIDTELLLEMESEIRDFCAGVLHALIEFKYKAQGKIIPPDLEVKIKDSSVVRSSQNAEAERKKAETERKKAETTNMQLNNLKLKKELGFKVSPQELQELGFESAEEAEQAIPQAIPQLTGVVV